MLITIKICLCVLSAKMLKRARENETREGRGSTCKEGPRKSFPAPNLISWQPLRDLSEVLTEND